MRFLPAPDEAIWLGVARFVVRVPGSRSLKDRRHGVRSLKDRLANRLGASVAEVGHLAHHELAVLVATVVGNEPGLVKSRVDQLQREAGSHPELILVDVHVDVSRWPLAV